MHLPFTKRKIDYQKLADAIVNSPSAKDRIREELWLASCNKNFCGQYLPTKSVKTNYRPSLSINVDIQYNAEGRVRPFGQDNIVLKLSLMVYENDFLIGQRRCHLYYDTPEGDYVGFDITSAHDHSEISEEGLDALNDWCERQYSCQKKYQNVENER